MSGPKVIRIRTREEIEAICKRQLAQVDVALKEWLKVCRRNDAATDEEVTKVLERRKELEQLLMSGKLVELQREAPSEVLFLKKDKDERLHRVLEKKAEAERSHNRLRRTAKSLLESVGKSGQAIPNDLRLSLENPQSGEEELEKAVSRGLSMLCSDEPSAAMPEKLWELVEAHGAGEKRSTVETWIAEHASPEDEDEEISEITVILGKIKELGGESQSALLEQRVRKVREESSTQQRRLLADSLITDLRSTLKQLEAQSAYRLKLAELLGELTRFSSKATRAISAELQKALDGEYNREQATTLIQKAELGLEEEMKALASSSRRRAILSGLQRLGYEVSEGMETAWVNNGRIVVRKTPTADYGIELGGGSESERLQIRAVGFKGKAGVGNPVNDSKFETTWCGEFQRLRELVNAGGGDIVLEKALEPGAVPMKVIEMETSMLESAASAPRLRALTQKPKQ